MRDKLVFVKKLPLLSHYISFDRCFKVVEQKWLLLCHFPISCWAQFMVWYVDPMEQKAPSLPGEASRMLAPPWHPAWGLQRWRSPAWEILDCGSLAHFLIILGSDHIRISISVVHLCVSIHIVARSWCRNNCKNRPL